MTEFGPIEAFTRVAVSPRISADNRNGLAAPVLVRVPSEHPRAITPTVVYGRCTSPRPLNSPVVRSWPSRTERLAVIALVGCSQAIATDVDADQLDIDLT